MLPEASPLPNFVFTFLPHLYLLISYQLERVATDAEWDDYLATMATAMQSGQGQSRCLVITEGAHPTRAQQAQLMALVKGKPGRVAR